jgi:hypothetical protein
MRCVPTGCMPIRCKAYEMQAFERHAHERDAPMRCTPLRCTLCEIHTRTPLERDVYQRHISDRYASLDNLLW